VVLIQHSPANAALPVPFAGAEFPELHDPIDRNALFKNDASDVIGNGEPGVASVACDAITGDTKASHGAAIWMNRRELMTGGAALAAYGRLQSAQALTPQRVLLGGAGKPQILGSLYSKASWSNLNDFYIAGTSPTIVGNAIQAASSAGNFNQYIEIASQTTCDGNIVFQVTLQFVSLGDGFGISIGRNSIISGSTSGFSAHYSTGSNEMEMWPQAAGSATTPFQTQAFGSAALNVGDIFRMTQVANLFTFLSNRFDRPVTRCSRLTASRL
jgi:hypothetical protein